MADFGDGAGDLGGAAAGTLDIAGNFLGESIAGTAMVPEHIWKSNRQPGHVRGPQPGRHRADEAEQLHAAGLYPGQEPLVLAGLPGAVPKVFFPVYTSNTSALSALFSGHIDWTGNYIPGLQHSFISTNPEFHHHWEAPGGTNSLVPNLNKWPTNQLPVRQAISAAINRQLLASEGESGLENPVLNATGLTPAAIRRLERPGRQHDRSPPRAARPPRSRSCRRPATPRDRTAFFAKDGKKGLDHDHEPVRLHRLRPGRLPRRAATEGGRDRRQLPGPVGGRMERRRRLG